MPKTNKSGSKKNIAFVICPIDKEGSPIRKHSDQLLKHIITPIAKEFGYEPVRADKISEPGMITNQIIARLVEDPLVIADLSFQNPNVFYELAIRHAIKKPFVQIIKKGDKIPFDVSGLRTIELDMGDLDSVENAKKELRGHIEAIKRNPTKVDSPITMALDLESLRSGKPEQKALAEISRKLENIENRISGIYYRAPSLTLRPIESMMGEPIPLDSYVATPISDSGFTEYKVDWSKITGAKETSKEEDDE